MTRPPCLRLCPVDPDNPRDNIEGESPLQGKGHTVFETGATRRLRLWKRTYLRPPQDEADTRPALLSSRFIVDREPLLLLRPSQRKHKQHRLVAHLAQLRR